MGVRRQPFINRQVVGDVEYIEANSPDVLVDLGVLMHVQAKRKWSGSYQGWTDCPTTWLGESSRMGRRRVKESLERLTRWGILVAMSTNGDPKKMWMHRPTQFRYDLRNRPPKGEEKAFEAAIAEEEDQQQEALEYSRPALKSDEHGAFGEVWHLDRASWEMVSSRVSPAEYIDFPVCQTCGKVFHPTEGRGARENQCAKCSIRERLVEYADSGQAGDLTIRSPYGERTWSRREVQEILEKTV